MNPYNQVIFNPKLFSSTEQTKEEEKHTTINPAFRNLLRAGFLREAMNKKAGDVGWENQTKTIPNTGYKNFDKNNDSKITIADLKLYAPNIKNQLNRIEQAFGKKEGDTDWEDIYTQIKRWKWQRVRIGGYPHHYRRWGWWRYWWYRPMYRWQKVPYYETRLIQEGAKRADFNKDGKIDKEDIFKLWASYNLPNLDLLKKAYGKTSNDVGWEDKQELIKLGYKNADVNLDNIVDDLDASIIFSAIYPDGTLVKSSANNIYMIVSGTKKRIPDEKTFNNLGLDKSQIITLKNEELKLIPDGEEIPLIKYDNGTLLKVKIQGYKHFDKNLDEKVTIEDLKLYLPELRKDLTKIERGWGKQEGDPGWEDTRKKAPVKPWWVEKYWNHPQWGRRIQYWWNHYWQRYWYRWEIQQGYKHADFNNDGKIDKEDIFKLWVDANGPNLEVLKKAYGKTSSDTGWENERYYLMAYGLRREIPNDLTLKNLDLDKSKAIEISAEELNDIPEGTPVPHFEYPIGTVLKNSESNEEKYYLITAEGTKKLIPDKKTLENLELDISKVKQVSTSKLTDIPDDPEPFPHLEFKNGSILKSGDKYYYTMMDKKIEVPDKMTLEAHGLDVKPYTITVRAKGTKSGGSYPLIQLRVDGQVAKEWFVTDEYKDYTITVPLSLGNHKIDVVYPNDQDINTWIHTWRTKHGKWYRRKYTYHQKTIHNVTADRNLYIDYIKVGNQKIEAEDFTRVKYDRASNQNLKSALDGKNVISGQEHMHTAGALRFDVDINPVINNVSQKQLDKLETTMTLNKVKYPNGTIIKDTDGKLWLMEQGIRRLIEDETTLRALNKFSDWQDVIKSGREVKIIFDKTSDKFNDEGYTGSYRTDPMGTLKGNMTYQLKYKNGVFSVTGYNEGTRAIGTWNYSNANIDKNQISLWGRVYTFNNKGEIFDYQYGLVGHMCITEGNRDITPEFITVSDTVNKLPKFSNWKDKIKSGNPVLVFFDKTSDKFNDEGYTGSYRTDPMGTLKGNMTYQLKYKNGIFSVTGYNEGTRAIGTWNYSNANINKNQISLWGRIYTFNEKGEVFDSQYGLVGHLRAVEKPDTPEDKNIITTEEFNSIPQGDPIKIKYTNGTILEDSEGNKYLMQQGVRRLIPDRPTFETLGVKEKDIITSQTPKEYFNDNLYLQDYFSTWTKIGRGRWTAQNGIYQGVGRATRDISLINNLSLKNFEMSVKVRNITFGRYSHSSLIPIRYRDIDNLVTLIFNPNKITLNICEGGRWKTLDTYYTSVESGKWYDVKIKAEGDNYQVFIDGEKKLEATYHSNSLGDRLGVWVYERGIAQFDNIKVKQLEITEEELNSIPEGTPLVPVPYPNKTLVKGSGDAVYLIMGGQKKYIPGGVTFDNLCKQLGINKNNIKTISDTELANILTDDGVPKVDFYHTKTVKRSFWKGLLNIVAPFIPVIGQLYAMYQGFRAIKDGNYLQGALGFLGGLGQLSKFSGQFGKFGAIGKLAGNINKLNNISTISNLVNLANTINTINRFSMALFANDLTDGSGRKVRGVNQFLAGLQATKFGLGYIGSKFDLSDAQLEYLVKTDRFIDKIGDYYQKGVIITGKEKIFGGDEVSDEERISLAGNLLSEHIRQAASNPNVSIGNAIKQGFTSFITDMVVETPVNLMKDATWLANKGTEMLVEKALQSFSSLFNTGYNQATIDNIVKGINFPLNILNDAMQIYNNTARWLTIEQVKNIVYRFFSDKIDSGEITIPEIENPGQSTDTFTGINEENSVEFKQEVEKAKNIIKDAIKLAGNVGKEVVVNRVIEALKKEGYTLAATTLKGLMKFDLAGAFDAISVSNPTDVAKVIRQQGNEFIHKISAEISQRAVNDPLFTYQDSVDAYDRLKISVNQAIEDYLTNKIKYYDPATDIKVKLVFPDIKFDFESFMRNDYWVEEVKLK